MPLYEYKCLSCSNLSEVIQRMDDAPLSTCDECGGELKKLLSAPAFQFKGSGWYVTDYANKSGGNGKEGSGDGDSKAKPDSKSDAGDAGKSEKQASPKASEPQRKTKSERIMDG